jgi:hypothetical protein
MELRDIAQLNQELQGLYGDRYAGMTSQMVAIWYKHLRHFPADLGSQAIERWAVSHQLYQLPTLEDLAASMERLQEERRRTSAWTPQQRSTLTDEELLALRNEKALPPDELQAMLYPLYKKLGMVDDDALSPDEDARRAELRRQVAQAKTQEVA